MRQKRRCKFTNRYTLAGVSDATRCGEGAQADSRCCLCRVSPAWLQSREHGRDRQRRTRYQTHAVPAFLQQGCAPDRGAGGSTSVGALDAFRTFGDRLSGSAKAMINGLFSELAVWADKPRWAGSGFTRLVIELADLPGHPARLIARRHNRCSKHIWQIVSHKPVSAPPRARPRNLAAVRGCNLP